jgi:hypothetical protein
MTAHSLTWEDIIGHGQALFALDAADRLCVLCAGVARLYVHREGEPIPCTACGQAIVPVSMIEGQTPGARRLASVGSPDASP